MGARLLSTPKITIRQIKAARALLGWSQDDLASRSALSIVTVKRIESAEGEIGGREETREAIVGALKEGGIEFIPENGGGAGVRLVKRQRRSR
jgi:transcriptional regulator with XRE-family HTH domain